VTPPSRTNVYARGEAGTRPVARRRSQDRPEGIEAPPEQTRLVINGRFLTQRLSGVQRFASEIVHALDERLAADDAAYPGTVEIHVPPNCEAAPRFRAIKLKRSGKLAGHAWEQFELLRAARGARLLSLCNTGPLLHPRQLVVIHDVAVLAYPDNFTFAFRSWYRLLFNVFGRYAHVATVSEFSASELSRYLALPRNAIRVIPNGGNHLAAIAADDSVIKDHGLSAGGYVLAIASTSKTKNIAIIGAALAQLPPPRPPLVLVAARADRIFQCIETADADAAIVLGGLSDGQLKALYRNALCFVFPSLYEGFGLPPLEAMSCGCPVLASDIDVLHEVCGDTAVFFDPRSPADLARKIAGLIGDGQEPTRKRVISGSARASTFNWRESAELLLRLIREV
jgi:glycosyltransferase involved in cell wall biosynthesis